jgi:hypothetical protein
MLLKPNWKNNYYNKLFQANIFLLCIRHVIQNSEYFFINNFPEVIKCAEYGVAQGNDKRLTQTQVKFGIILTNLAEFCMDVAEKAC